jgi:hypothetical protein
MPRPRPLKIAAKPRAGSSKPKTPPKPPTLKVALSRMNDSYLLCRDFGHMWRPYQARYIPQRKQYEERLRCERCTTVRVRLLTNTGAQLGNAYIYADGYTMEGFGRLTGTDRDAVRLASLQTVLELSGVERIDPRKRRGA